jgi:hypothetical protein
LETTLIAAIWHDPYTPPRIVCQVIVNLSVAEAELGECRDSISSVVVRIVDGLHPGASNGTFWHDRTGRR